MSAVDKLKNNAENAEGKVTEAIGRASNDKDTEAAGRRTQAKSDLKNAGEKVKDALHR